MALFRSSSKGTRVNLVLSTPLAYKLARPGSISGRSAPDVRSVTPQIWLTFSGQADVDDEHPEKPFYGIRVYH